MHAVPDNSAMIMSVRTRIDINCAVIFQTGLDTTIILCLSTERMTIFCGWLYLSYLITRARSAFVST